MYYKVLFADDSKIINNVMAFALENNKFEVETCNTRDEIEDKILSKTFDLIIVSQVLEGISIAKTISKSKLNHKTEIFILSKESDINIKKTAKENNVNGWITKPFIPEKLVKTLKNHIIKINSTKK